MIPTWRTALFWLLSPLWLVALALAFLGGGLVGVLGDVYRWHSKP